MNDDDDSMKLEEQLKRGFAGMDTDKHIEASARGGKGGEPSKRGFAVMPIEQVRAIASRGGKAAHRQGKGHEWDRESARIAGKKGGLASRGGRGKAAVAGVPADAKTPITSVPVDPELAVIIEGHEARKAGAITVDGKAIEYQGYHVNSVVDGHLGAEQFTRKHGLAASFEPEAPHDIHVLSVEPPFKAGDIVVLLPDNTMKAWQPSQPEEARVPCGVCGISRAMHGSIGCNRFMEPATGTAPVRTAPVDPGKPG